MTVAEGGVSCVSDDAVSLRFIGCLVGGLIGDALGTPTEGMTFKSIQKKFPQGVSDFLLEKHMGLPHLPPRKGMYSDDTNSTLALAASLVEEKQLDPKMCALKYTEFFNTGIPL